MRLLAWASLMLVVVAVAGLAWWRAPPDLTAWRDGPPPESWATRELQLRTWAAAGVRRAIAFEYEPLSRIAIDVQVAALVGEDINFFGHPGIDADAIREALQEWWAGGRLRGASTVSQQLAKNLFLSHRRSWVRKLREARLAWWLERDLGKRRILELYLNVIELDEGVLGVGAAARHFYGKHASLLTADEAAGLAAAIPAPRSSNPATATRAWKNRKAVIAQRMRDVAWLRRRLESLR